MFLNGFFYSASEFYKEIFNCKVYKISIDAGCTCPNRDGTKGFGGCIFCNETGSGDFTVNKNLSIENQIEEAKKLVESKNKNGKYIAYFQNFTNTYGNPKNLIQKYKKALLCKDIVGLSVATRPDCINQEILDFLAETAKSVFVLIELGFQTCNEKVAEYINRCYKNSEYVQAVNKIKKANSKIHVVSHVIFGLPGETKNDMIKTVNFCIQNKTDGIKISLLHVLKNTKLENDYKNKLFECLQMSEYFEILSKALCIIPKNIVIHRLTGDGSKRNLIAPLWSNNKKYVYNSMLKYFKENSVFQGKDL